MRWRRRLAGGPARRRDVLLIAAAVVIWAAAILVAPAPLRGKTLGVGVIGWGLLLLWAAVLNLPRYLHHRRKTGVLERSRAGEWGESGS